MVFSTEKVFWNKINEYLFLIKSSSEEFRLVTRTTGAVFLIVNTSAFLILKKVWYWPKCQWKEDKS